MRIYTGTFLVAFTTLALEVTLTRVFSVITWYHLSFFAIATALLGMTAGAVVVYLVPQWFTERIADRTVARACLAFAGTILLALITISLVPVIVTRSIMPALSLLLLTAVSALPFFFSGIAVTALLTKYTIPIGRLYASDLIGAATGSLFVLIGLLVFSAPSLIILCSALAVVASLIFGWKHSSRTGHRLMIMLALCIMVIAVVNSATIYGIRPLFFKGNFVAPSDLYLEKWNSFSQVSIFKENQVSPFYWGASPLAPKDITVSEHKMRIDGEAGTRLQSFSSFDDIDFLRYDVTNIGYYLRSQGAALIIGAGGGRDVQSALLFGHRPVVGVDVNPVFIDLLQNDFRDFAGLANRDDVKLVVDEGRSFAATTSDTFSIIEMSLIDTWAATGAGAFSLSENSLYTVEAWQTFLDRLTDDGIFTVSRWYNPSDLGETGRVVSLALAALLERGASNPAQHLAMVTTDRISTLLVSKNPFTPQDIVTLRQATDDLQFQLVMAPGIEPKEAFLKNLHAVKSLEELKAAIAGQPLNYEPPTDENPYFFNMLRLDHLDRALASGQGALSGNLIASLTLIGLIFSLAILAIITIVLPLWIKSRTQDQHPPQFWAGALYFSLIGAGFMFVEIGLIQRLSVFLSHPIYALGVLLFTIIASTGVGSFFSERLSLDRIPWIYVYPTVTTMMILTLRFILPPLISNLITIPIPIKIAISVIVIFPMGILMGLFFPTGMRLARASYATETPWYWALNGIFGVLCSALGVFVAIYIGISANFDIAALCYAGVLLALHQMHRIAQERAKSLTMTAKGETVEAEA